MAFVVSDEKPLAADDNFTTFFFQAAPLVVQAAEILRIQFAAGLQRPPVWGNALLSLGFVLAGRAGGDARVDACDYRTSDRRAVPPGQEFAKMIDRPISGNSTTMCRGSAE